MIRRRKLPENATESPASGARFVGKNWGKHDTPPKNQNHAFNWLDFTRTTIFYKPDFDFGKHDWLTKTQSWELAETFAKKIDFAKSGLCQKKTNLAKKPELNLPKLFLKILKPISETWLNQREGKP